MKASWEVQTPSLYNVSVPLQGRPLFRHHLLTHLARNGIIDSKMQLISGHSDRDSLSVYQDLSLGDVANEYQDAMKDFPVL